jgi:hypothetical protein
MSLDKETEFGKEKIEKFRGTRNFDVSCRSHVSFAYCKHNRHHSNLLREITANEQLSEYMKEA